MAAPSQARFSPKSEPVHWNISKSRERIKRTLPRKNKHQKTNKRAPRNVNNHKSCDFSRFFQKKLFIQLKKSLFSAILSVALLEIVNLRSLKTRKSVRHSQWRADKGARLEKSRHLGTTSVSAKNLCPPVVVHVNCLSLSA